MEKTTLNAQTKQALIAQKPRSAWGRGVRDFAIDLLGEWEEGHPDEVFIGNPANKKELLNGADSWAQYSWGGCYLIYDTDIAEALCNPTELKRSKGGENPPNAREEWLDVQARALSQAASLLIRTAKEVNQ